MTPPLIPSPSLRDLTASAPLVQTSRAAMSVVSGVQHVEHRGARLLGLVVAALIAAEASRLSPADLFAYARNCMNDAEGRRPEFKAVDEYVRKEILSPAD